MDFTTMAIVSVASLIAVLGGFIVIYRLRRQRSKEAELPTQQNLLDETSLSGVDVTAAWARVNRNRFLIIMGPLMAIEFLVYTSAILVLFDILPWWIPAIPTIIFVILYIALMAISYLQEYRRVAPGEYRAQLIDRGSGLSKINDYFRRKGELTQVKIRDFLDMHEVIKAEGRRIQEYIDKYGVMPPIEAISPEVFHKFTAAAPKQEVPVK